MIQPPARLADGVTLEQAFAHILRTLTVIAPALTILLRNVEPRDEEDSAFLKETHNFLVTVGEDCFTLWENDIRDR